MRRGELLGLRWDDVDLVRGLVTVRNNLVRVGNELQLKSPKTEDSSRTLSLSGPMLSLLKLDKGAPVIQKNALGKYYYDQGFVFALEDGSSFHPDTFTHAFADFLKANNLKKIRLHDLRHTNATLLLSSGVAAKVVSNRLGHSNIGITLDLYSHVLRSMEEDAAETIDGIMFKKNSPKI